LSLECQGRLWGPVPLGYFSATGPGQHRHHLRLLPCFNVIEGDRDEETFEDYRNPYSPDTILVFFNATIQQGRRRQARSKDDEAFYEPGKVDKVFNPEMELRVFGQIGAVEVLEFAGLDGQEDENQWIDTNFVLVLSLAEGFENRFLVYNWKQRGDPRDPDMPVRDVRSDMQEDAIRESGKLIPSGVMTPFVYCRVLTSLEELLDAQQPDIELHHRPQYGN